MVKNISECVIGNQNVNISGGSLSVNDDEVATKDYVDFKMQVFLDEILDSQAHAFRMDIEEYCWEMFHDDRWRDL